MVSFISAIFTLSGILCSKLIKRNSPDYNEVSKKSEKSITSESKNNNLYGNENTTFSVIQNKEPKKNS